MEIASSFLILLLALILIVFACVVFTNAIEHLGEHLNLSEGAVGSVLAAVGTALPETIVPIVAILGAYLTGADISKGEEIGIGAILGAPFMLGTLAFFVTGIAVIIFAKMGKRSTDMPVNTRIMFRDIHYFSLSYFIAIMSSFIPFKPVKYAICALLLVIYGIYVVQTVRKECQGDESDSEICNIEELETLYLEKILPIAKLWRLPGILFQVFLSLLGIIFLAHFFVENLKHVAEAFSINPLILSLILTPIATELPEKFNSVIWIKAKKDTLAMGNITGAMVFQSCIPPIVGIAFTPWVLNLNGIINVVIVYLSVLVVYLNIIRNKGVLKPSALLTGGLFYLIYLVFIMLEIFGIIKL